MAKTIMVAGNPVFAALITRMAADLGIRTVEIGCPVEALTFLTSFDAPREIVGAVVDGCLGLDIKALRQMYKTEVALANTSVSDEQRAQFNVRGVRSLKALASYLVDVKAAIDAQEYFDAAIPIDFGKVMDEVEAEENGAIPTNEFGVEPDTTVDATVIATA
jgi:hypothetical protein